jgi:putative polyketide hydroxylase
MQPLVDDFSMEIGYRYNSGAVVLEGDDDHPLHEHPRESKGRPGSRAPHVFLDHRGARVSVLDLFGGNFVLLAGAEGDVWCAAALRAARRLRLPLDAYRVGSAELADPADRFHDAYGISPAGAVIVRPDGFVGWRARDAAGAAEEVAPHALRSLLCLGDG